MRKWIGLALIIMFAACGKQTFFADQYQPAYNSFPLSSSSCAEFYGTMVSQSQAAVMGIPYVFYGNNNFQTLSYIQYENYQCYDDVIFFDGASAWVQSGNYYNGPPFGKSAPRLIQASAASVADLDFSAGSSSVQDYSFAPALQGPFRFVPTPTFFNASRFLTAEMQYQSVYGESPTLVNFYLGDISKKSAYVIASITDLSNNIGNYSIPIGVYRSGNWVLFLCGISPDPIITASENYYYITTDGISWLGPLHFPTNDYEELDEILGTNDLMVARVRSAENYKTTLKFSYHCYYSIDLGKTWVSFGNLPGNVKFAQVLPDGSVYAVIDAGADNRFDLSKLAKSSDGGQTWTIIDKLVYANRISFYDSLHGIAMYNQILQSTNDGGKSWKLILSNP